MKRFYYCILMMFLFISVISFCSGCSGPKQMKVPVYQPVEVGGETKTLAFGKLSFDIQMNAAIGERKSGTPCIIQKGPVRWGGISKKPLYDAFNKVLANKNYNILGDPDELFEDNSSEAELVIGARFTNIILNIYHDNFFNDYTRGKSNASVQVEWQIYDPIQRKTVYKVTTHGAANEEFSGGYQANGILGAFINATDALLTDKGFHDIVKKNVNPVFSTVEKSQFFYSAGHNTKRTLEDVKKSVVTVQVGSGHGSGFVISSEGLVITNHHVVGTAREVTILTSNGKRYLGVVIAHDSHRDVAAVLVKDLALPPLQVRTSSLKVGEDVFAIGSPVDISLAGTVTKGIFSGMRDFRQKQWIQSDATINPGNSGGPLVDSSGNVMGISTLTRADAQGIYFFAPIEDALKTVGISSR